MTMRTFLICAVFISITCLSSGNALAQSINVDGTGFVNLYIKAISTVPAADKKGARTLFARQIEFLSEDQRINAWSALIAALRSSPTAGNAADILPGLLMPWASRNTSGDADYIYNLYMNQTDQTLKNQLDLALSYARGLYRDGIADYNSGKIEQFTTGAAKLEAMFSKYPRSEYAENANFYLGQFFIKAYFLGVAPIQDQIKKSNSAFESYIQNVEANRYVTNHFRAAGYFFRAVNGWISDDLPDSKKWLNAPKLQDDETVYIWQLFYSPNLAATKIDRYCRARPLFSAMMSFLNRAPAPRYNDAGPFIAVLQKCP